VVSVENSNIFVHIPFRDREKYLPLAIREGLNPEFYLPYGELDSVNRNDLSSLKSALNEAGLSCSVHGPYGDLCIGASDPKIKAVTKERIIQAVHVASSLQARTLVLHPGYEPFKYDYIKERWLNNCVDLLNELGDIAGEMGVVFALENTFEETPDILHSLVSRLDSDIFGHCFDIGHFNILGKCELLKWLSKIGSRLLEIHLHDNNGRTDEHNAIGDGNVDFKGLFRILSDLQVEPMLTIESHDAEKVLRSVSRLKAILKASR